MNATRLPYAVIPSREEMRRIRHREECERARRGEAVAAWFKVIVTAAVTTVIVAATYALVFAHNRRVNREVDVELMKADVYALTMEAADAVRRDPGNGLAKFALLAGLALYCADVKEEI